MTDTDLEPQAEGGEVFSDFTRSLVDADFEPQAALVERLAARKRSTNERQQLTAVAETLRGLIKLRHALEHEPEEMSGEVALYLMALLGIKPPA